MIVFEEGVACLTTTNKKLTDHRFTFKGNVFQWQDQKQTSVLVYQMTTAPYQGTIWATPGHKVVFSYIITESGSGTTKKWISLQGLGRNQIRERINEVKISNLVLIFENFIDHSSLNLINALTVTKALTNALTNALRT